jgi:hypothetical protein
VADKEVTCAARKREAGFCARQLLAWAAWFETACTSQRVREMWLRCEVLIFDE